MIEYKKDLKKILSICFNLKENLNSISNKIISINYSKSLANNNKLKIYSRYIFI